MSAAAFLSILLAAAPAAAASPDASAPLDATVREFLSRQDVPAAHVTLLRGDQVLLQRGYGSAAPGGTAPDAGTLFPVGSISKQFTAAAVLALADEGRLRLDAPARDYLPEWFAGEPELRVSHLVSQTSGLADFLWLDGYRRLADDPATRLADYVALGAAEPRRFAPGTRWAYSNTNYKALALIVERVAGRPFDEVLAEKVLRPAGIADVVPCHRLRPGQFVAGVDAAGKPARLDASAAAYAGDGGLCASAAALAKWLRLALAAREGPWTRLAGSATLADGTRAPYGFGVSTRPFLGQPAVWHGGSVNGHSAIVAYLPTQDLGIVVLAARESVWLTELMAPLAGLPAPAPAAAPAAALAGRFEDGLFRYDVAPAGEALEVGIDLIGTLRFVPAGPLEYVAEKWPATFRLRLPADGTVGGFEMDWGEFRSYARREETGAD